MLWDFKLFYHSSCINKVKHVLRSNFWNWKLALSLKWYWQSLQTVGKKHSTTKILLKMLLIFKYFQKPAFLYSFSITQLVDKRISCILIGYATIGLLVSHRVAKFAGFVNPFISIYSQINFSFCAEFIIAFFCPTSWVILKQLDPSPSRATDQ